MKINLDNWAAHKGSTKIPVPQKCTIELMAVAASVITISGIGHDGEFIIAAGTGRLHLKCVLENAEAIKITSKEFGLTAKINGTKIGEPMNDLPAPPKKEPANILQRLRAKAREDMQITREHFMNDTGLPGHEVDLDDDEIEFEEEELQRIADAQNQETQQTQTQEESSTDEQASDENPTTETET